MIGSISKFMRLPAPERRLIARASVLVAVVRVVLWSVPWPRVLPLLRGRLLNRLAPPLESGYTPEKLARIVGYASRPIPAATCLTQALALQWFMVRAGYPCRVELGVAATGRGIAAHAWVE